MTKIEVTVIGFVAIMVVLYPVFVFVVDRAANLFYSCMDSFFDLFNSDKSQ